MARNLRNQFKSASNCFYHHQHCHIDTSDGVLTIPIFSDFVAISHQKGIQQHT